MKEKISDFVIKIQVKDRAVNEVMTENKDLKKREPADIFHNIRECSVLPGSV